MEAQGALAWRRSGRLRGLPARNAIELLHLLTDLLGDGSGIDQLIARRHAEQSGVLLTALH